MIDKFTTEKILEAAQIVEVVSDFVTLRKRGVNYIGLCPFHEDKSPSFTVSPSKNICKCFACGEGGAPVHFIMKHEQLSFHDALKYLAKKYNIEVKEREMTDEERVNESKRESMFIINDYASRYFVKNLQEDAEGKTIGLSYFKERGFREDTINKFQLGYSLEKKDAFTTDAIRLGYKKELLIKTGLSFANDDRPPMDRFRGRVMFPIHSIGGKVVGFGGRTLSSAKNIAKYVNSPESEIYSKSNELYGLFLAKKAIVKEDSCFLVEGYTDVISMHQAGIENVVASSGTALTIGQIKKIRRFSENITVIYDGDSAGIKAALRGIDLILEEGMNVKVVLLPQGEDPDSFAKGRSATEFSEYIEKNRTDFIRFKTELLLNEAGDDPIKKAGLITEIVKSIAIIPLNITRAVYVKECSSQMGISEKILINEVNKIRLRDYKKSGDAKPQLRKLESSYSGEEEYTPPPYADMPTTHEHYDREPLIYVSSTFDKFEREIIRYIIRYGTTPISRTYKKEKVKEEGNIIVEKDILQEQGPAVIEYIKFDLNRDGIELHNPLFKKIFEEACYNMNDISFNPSRYFLSHPDQSISLLAGELLSDRYQLSKIHTKSVVGDSEDNNDSKFLEENSLITTVPRIITELKNEIVMQRIDEVQKKIRNLHSDSEELMTLMQEFRQLQNIKKQLAKILGERIVLR